MLTRILCRGESANFTIEVRIAAGGYVAREISAAPVRDEGSVVGLFGAGRLRVESPSAESPRGVPRVRLTGRQYTVLHLLAEGLSTEEIASQLKLRQTTVRNHIA